jgi:hypothetical protein
MALSWQGPVSDADADAVSAVPSGVPGVPGVPELEASGVDVGGTSVGRDSPGLVGGRVDVTKMDRVGGGVSCETVRQEPRLRLASRNNNQIFFMRGILQWKYYKVAHNLLNFRFEVRSANSPKVYYVLL